MICQTCNHKDNFFGRGIIQRNMTIIPCPDCRDGELKLWFGLNFDAPPNDLINAVNRTE